VQIINMARWRAQRTPLILGTILTVSILTGVVAAWEPSGFNWRGLLSNLATELVGGVFTYFVIDQLISRNEDEDKLKQRLIREMENPENGIVVRAAQELRSRGWLQDGALFGWFLQRANMQGLDLRDADLRGFGLYRSNLTDARVDDIQLVQMNDLRLCVMPDGKRYDGRYCLRGDIDWAMSRYELDFRQITTEQMAEYYGVSVERFMEGQAWAQENLPRLGVAMPDYFTMNPHMAAITQR
jgi:hypothetical protein